MSEWISIKDRLPEKEDEYLVYPYSEFAGVTAVFWPYDDFKQYKKNTFFYRSEFDEVAILNITHWMPLPQPPKDNQC